MKYKFVYSLINDNGQVFYIGCTQDTAKRYSQHLMQPNKPTETSKYIAEMLSRNVIPEMRIIDYLPEDEAHIKEAEILCLFGKIGQPLTNRVYYWIRRIEYSLNDYNKNDAIKVLDYRQKVFIYHKNAYNRISSSFPLNPDVKKKL